MNTDTVQQIQQVLDHQFNDPQILDEAFMHSSAAGNRLRSNERMEFLGDSVLSLVICDTLFKRFPDYLEGDLTKIKSRLVSRKTCAEIANQLQLPNYMRVGKGMECSPAMCGSVAAASLESVIAAIYLDSGMAAAEKFILNVFDPLIAPRLTLFNNTNYIRNRQLFFRQKSLPASRISGNSRGRQCF